MIGVFVSFTYGDDFDRDRVERIAREAQSMFRGMPGLRLKCFMVDAAGHKATNVYLWESRAAADGFFTDELRERVTTLYGVQPEITFADVLEVVDNSALEPTP
jgi:hypothetical protein